MSRNTIATKPDLPTLPTLALWLALWLCAGPAQAQLFGLGFGGGPPDAARFGARMEIGDIASAREWLDAGLHPDFVADRIGTGLMIAAATGNIALMELFVSRGADPNKTNAADEQALMHAAWRGKLDAVRWLLAHGARINREPMKWTALHYAVFAGHEEVAAYLIEQGANINARSTNGSSVLMMAVFEGHEQLTRRLLARGADTAIKNDNGDGALEWAFKFKHPDIARIVTDKKTFDAAAELPQAYWGEVMRSVTAAQGQAMQAAAAGAPPPKKPALSSQIDELASARATLAARGLTASVEKIDRRIEQLRAAQERARLQALRPSEPMTAATSAPEPGQIEALTNMRNTLAARGMSDAADKLDRRIATLRAKRAKPDLDTPDDAVLRITATRRAPTGKAAPH